jgi:hypothetical protein
MQERIEAAGANSISMPRQLLDHPQPEYGLFDGVV